MNMAVIAAETIQLVVPTCWDASSHPQCNYAITDGISFHQAVRTQFLLSSPREPPGSVDNPYTSLQFRLHKLRLTVCLKLTKVLPLWVLAKDRRKIRKPRRKSSDLVSLLQRHATMLFFSLYLPLSLCLSPSLSLSLCLSLSLFLFSSLILSLNVTTDLGLRKS